MVLTRPLGKRRAFSRGFVLTVLTLGLYAVYWMYKAPTEVHKQFQLEEEQRDDGVAWLVLSLMLPVLVIVYNFRFLGYVRYVRERLGLRRGTSPWTFTALLFVGGFIIVAGVGGGLVMAGDVLLEDEEYDPLTPDAFEPLPPDAGLLMLAGVVLGVPVVAAGYYLVQRDLNEVWAAYDARLAALTAPRDPSPPPPRPE